MTGRRTTGHSRRNQHRRSTPRFGGERGSATAELVLLTPLLIAFLLFVVLLGREVSARLQVESAASQAARAASLTRDPASATLAAQQTAAGTLTGSHHTCTRLTVATDTSHFTAAGWVAVTVTCTVNNDELTGLHLPATTTISSRFVEPLDTYRATT
jgi:Flp pilus assembly protein TadG